ncbi:MAG: LacI family transcriptional regulator [Pyrinomonadaceae bacterium]|nr:LacI family transcriptional regulator [Pyrinomonadaceae bacterium]
MISIDLEEAPRGGDLVAVTREKTDRAKATRIDDVARAAGVSTATVSNVINETKRVAATTRASVLDAIERCNYYPNAQARSLASGRTRIIGLLSSDFASPLFPELVKSFEMNAFERGYNTVLLNTNYDPHRAADHVRRLIGLKVAGVALMTAKLDPGLIHELIGRNISVVSQNLDKVSEHMSNVVIDYAVGVDEAVAHLASLGHRHIVHVAASDKPDGTNVRRDAFLESVARHVPNARTAVYEGDFRFESGQRAAIEILAAAELPTAVLAANDMMAFGLMKEMRKAGLSIPRDISLIGFDDTAFAELSEPALTTVCLSRAELGRRTVEALMKNIAQPGAQGKEVRIPTYLVKRGSTAPPRP